MASKEETTLIQAIGDVARPSMIPLRDRCTLTMISGPLPGSIFTLESDELVLGRAPKEGARIDDSGLSRQHIRVFRVDEKYFVEDMGSTNGTFVNGTKLAGPQALTSGDRIHLGKNTLLRVDFLDPTEQAAARRMYEAAVRDALTQAYNRRFFDERLQSEFGYAQRHQALFSLLILDIDHFKVINDTYGHVAGDAVLRVVSATLQRVSRIEDMVARYGGEEFAVIARGTDLRNAAIFAERIRRTIGGTPIPWEGKGLTLTVSIGIATFGGAQAYAAIAELVAAADAALYRAKEAGRNRCLTAV